MFEDIVETVREPLIVLDADLRVLSANSSFYAAFRVLPGETIGRLIYDLGNRQWDIPGLRTLLEDILPENNKFDDYEVDHVFSGVGHKIMLLNARRIMHKEIGSQKILLAIEDITDRKRMESELTEYEERFRQLFETAKDGLLLINKQNGKIANVNPAIVEMLGYSSNELIGKQLQDIGLLKDIKDFKETIRKLIQAGFIDYENVLAETKQGQLIDVDLYLVDRARFIQCNVRDITERKRLSAQLLQSQKMEAIGHLVAGITHDFNNILSGIMAYQSLVDEEMKDDDPLRPYLHELDILAQKAAILTRSLLAYCRKQVMEMTPSDINYIVSDIEKLLNRLISENIEFNVRVAEEALISNVDRGQIEQVLLNLATNSRDAMPNGGVLTISTERMQIDSGFIQANGFGKVGDYAVLSVADTGVGMDEKIKEHIFEPFFTTKEVGKGTGLGLAMVYGIIKQHNGFISLYSKPGDGTIFKIYLPLLLTRENIPEKSALTSVPSGDETILLAEDDPTLRKVLRKFLENHGYTVLEAVNGEEALNVFSKENAGIDIIVTDMIMPKIHGNELYEKAKIMRPDIKVLFMSGYSIDIIAKKGVLNEELNVLSKPFGPFTLMEKVREVLDRE